MPEARAMSKGWACIFEQPVPYEQTVQWQEELVAARLAEEIPDVALCLQHRPVVTLGRRGRDNHLLVDPDVLRSRGVAVVHAARGGDVTYHGPGQVVLYPIFQLGRVGADLHGYLWQLEEVALRTAETYGVKAFRREGMNGAWTEQGKIAAIGFRIQRGVSSHGMSFNVCPDMQGFQTITPCGLAGEPVASLQQLLGASCPDVLEVGRSLCRHLGDVCKRDLSVCEPGSEQWVHAESAAWAALRR